MSELLETLAMLIEDAAALGDTQALELLSTGLNHVAMASNCRGVAVRMRLEGDIDAATSYEAHAEWALEHAGKKI